MGRPRMLDKGILLKIAQKRGYAGDIVRVTKLISSTASRKKVSCRVALVLIADEMEIGTSNYQRKFSESERYELHHVFHDKTQSALPTKQTKRATQRKKLFEIVKYSSSDHFIKGHIEELNLAYSNGCYTCVFILARKIIENLVIDVLKRKFPENRKTNKELYFDIDQNRLKDFGVILKNLLKMKDNFGSDNVIAEKLFKRAKQLKDDANDKTHSWCHLVETRKEIDDLSLQAIIELIVKLEKNAGLR